MTPTNHAGQDAVVAVLQSQQGSLEASVRDLARTMSEGFASINTKMDRVNDIALSIAQMSERQIAHSEGLQRAFTNIEQVQESVARVTAEHAAYIESHTRDHNSIDKSLSLAKGIVLGAGVAYGVLVALLTWAASTYIGETRRNTEQIHELQLNEAKHRGNLP